MVQLFLIYLFLSANAIEKFDLIRKCTVTVAQKYVITELCVQDAVLPVSCCKAGIKNTGNEMHVVNRIFITLS